MPFEPKSFKECSHTDKIFEGLKDDYPGFEEWFDKKARTDETAYVYLDKGSIQAFLYVKEYEDEPIGNLPKKPRMKIGTMKVSDDYESRRFGEGAIGLALWRWQQSDLDEVYVTVYPKHEKLIGLLEMYGFILSGKKDQEDIYIKSKTNLDCSDPKKAFPYIDPNLTRGGYIPIRSQYHDKMFQNSELKNTEQIVGDMYVSNGLVKVYIATPDGKLDYARGDIVFIYRIANEHKSVKSVVSSYCTVLNIVPVREGGVLSMRFPEFHKRVGNKTVYSDEEMSKEFREPNVYLIELLYNGYFGKGHNVTYSALKKEGLFENHPYATKLARDEVFKIFKMGGKNEDDIIINKS